jgi:DNA-binding MarR family transcriptional regulator
MLRTTRCNRQSVQASSIKGWREAVPQDRLAHLIKEVMRGLTRVFQMRLREHSVSSGHWVFLRILWEHDGLTLSELSEAAGLMVPTTFSAVQVMDRLGYVTRTQQSDNRRKVYVFLTAKGRALRTQLVPIAETVNAVAVRGIPAAHVANMRRCLLTMMKNLEADEIVLQKTKRKMPSTRDLVHVAQSRAKRTALRPKRKR